MGAGDRLLCSRVSESCNVVGSLHLFIFVKKIFETKTAVTRSGSGLYRIVQRLTGTGLIQQFRYVPNCAEADWDWAGTAVPVCTELCRG